MVCPKREGTGSPRQNQEIDIAESTHSHSGALRAHLSAHPQDDPVGFEGSDPRIERIHDDEQQGPVATYGMCRSNSIAATIWMGRHLVFTASVDFVIRLAEECAERCRR
jgi:hypothetical protein